MIKTKGSKLIVLAVCAALVLSLGTVGVLAAANTSRIDPARLTVTESGVRIYNNMDENGAIDLTEAELQELYELMQARDENGNIIPPAPVGEGEKDGVITITVVQP